MPIVNISKGTGPNTGTGTPAREAADIINNNFAYILNLIKIKISGLYCEKYPGNTNPGAFELYDKFDGWIGNGRYVVGIVIAANVDLPADIDDETKVTLVINNPV